MAFRSFSDSVGLLVDRLMDGVADGSYCTIVACFGTIVFDTQRQILTVCLLEFSANFCFFFFIFCCNRLTHAICIIMEMICGIIFTVIR